MARQLDLQRWVVSHRTNQLIQYLRCIPADIVLVKIVIDVLQNKRIAYPEDGLQTQRNVQRCISGRVDTRYACRVRMEALLLAQDLIICVLLQIESELRLSVTPHPAHNLTVTTVERNRSIGNKFLRLPVQGQTFQNDNDLRLAETVRIDIVTTCSSGTV